MSEKEIIPPNINTDPNCEMKMFTSPLDGKISVVCTKNNLEVCHCCFKPFIETDPELMSGEFEIIGEDGNFGGVREKLHRNCYAEHIRKKYL